MTTQLIFPAKGSLVGLAIETGYDFLAQMVQVLVNKSRQRTRTGFDLKDQLHGLEQLNGSVLDPNRGEILVINDVRGDANLIPDASGGVVGENSVMGDGGFLGHKLNR